MVAETLKTIDRHARYRYTDEFHARSYYILKQYLEDLKSWIHAEEKKLK
jgi:hypothetical protein